MSEARLKAGILVSAMLRQANAANYPAAVLHKGDADAGGILLVLRGRQGLTVLTQIRTQAGEAAWMRATGADPVTQAAVDAMIARQLRFDRDSWVVEIETQDFLLPFPARIV